MNRYEIREAGSGIWLDEFSAETWDEAVERVGGEENLAGSYEPNGVTVVLLASDREKVAR